MKKATTILLCAVLGGTTSCHHESFDERCAREAREYTEKQCPRRMDAYTMMDSLTYDMTSHTLNYYYTTEGMLDSDSVMTSEFHDALERLLHEHILNSVDLKIYKEKGINFGYHYYSKSTGKERYQVLFTPEDYKGSPSAGQQE